MKCEFPSTQPKCELEQWRAGSSPVLNIAVWELSETCQADGPTLKRMKALKYLGVFNFPYSFLVLPQLWMFLWWFRPCVCTVCNHIFMLGCSVHLCGIFPSENGVSLCPESHVGAGMKFQWGGKVVNRRAARVWQYWCPLGQHIGWWSSQTSFTNAASSKQWEGSGLRGPKQTWCQQHPGSRLAVVWGRAPHSQHTLQGNLWGC